MKKNMRVIALTIVLTVLVLAAIKLAGIIGAAVVVAVGFGIDALLARRKQEP